MSSFNGGGVANATNPSRCAGSQTVTRSGMGPVDRTQRRVAPIPKPCKSVLTGHAIPVFKIQSRGSGKSRSCITAAQTCSCEASISIEVLVSAVAATSLSPRIPQQTIEVRSKMETIFVDTLDLWWNRKYAIQTPIKCARSASGLAINKQISPSIGKAIKLMPSSRREISDSHTHWNIVLGPSIRSMTQQRKPTTNGSTKNMVTPYWLCLIPTNTQRGPTAAATNGDSQFKVDSRGFCIQIILPWARRPMGWSAVTDSLSINI